MWGSTNTFIIYCTWLAKSSFVAAAVGGAAGAIVMITSSPHQMSENRKQCATHGALKTNNSQTRRVYPGLNRT